MMDLNSLLLMNGDGIYVWPSYGITMLGLFLLYIQSRYRLKKLQQRQQDIDTDRHQEHES